MNIDALIVTQDGLRDWSVIDSMTLFVKNGGLWNEDSLKSHAESNSKKNGPIISISKFEDGKLYVHDGHHRVCATLLAGREHLYESEYKLSEWKYYDYLELNISNNWFTPFDPRTHFRLNDFSNFKKIVKDLNPNEIESFIKNNFEMYAKERKFSSFKELLNNRK